MKNIILSVMVLIMAGASTFAHPGRVDSNGGHTCRTNCEEHELEQEEYHYHKKVDGIYDYSSYMTQEEFEYGDTEVITPVNTATSKSTSIEKSITSKKDTYKKIFKRTLGRRLARLSYKTLVLINKKVDKVLAKNISNSRREKIEALREVIEDIIRIKSAYSSSEL